MNPTVKMDPVRVESAQWMELLQEGAERLKFNLSPDHAAQFRQHARLLLDWNRSVNLTAINDPVEIAVKHFLDSAAPLEYVPTTGELLDIGTGGGFPGIPLKILRPAQSMTLVDGTRKKINFVKEVIRRLGLEKIDAFHLRAESMGTMDRYVGRFTAIVCRAVGDTLDMARLAMPLLAAGGKIVVYKGPGEKVPKKVLLDFKGKTEKETLALRATSIAYQLPIIKEQRQVVILETA